MNLAENHGPPANTGQSDEPNPNRHDMGSLGHSSNRRLKGDQFVFASLRFRVLLLLGALVAAKRLGQKIAIVH